MFFKECTVLNMNGLQPVICPLPSEFLKNSAAICVISVLKMRGLENIRIFFKNQHCTTHSFQNQLLDLVSKILYEYLNMNSLKKVFWGGGKSHWKLTIDKRRVAPMVPCYRRDRLLIVLLLPVSFILQPKDANVKLVLRFSCS